MDRPILRPILVLLTLTALTGCSTSATPPPATAAPVEPTAIPTAAVPTETPATPEPTAEPTPTPEPAHWISANSMARARMDFPLITLQDGRALAVGDGYTVCQPDTLCGSPYSPDQSAKRADLYDPSNNTWSATGGLNLDRADYSAILLQDGRVLIGGGYASPPSVCFQSAKLYDPAKGAWSQTKQLQKSDRCAPAGALLKDGRVLLMGGENYKGKTLSSAEIFDPADQSWASAATMPGPRSHGKAVTLGNGLVLLTSGVSGDNDLMSTWLFDPQANKWSVAGSLTHGAAGRLIALADGGALMLNDAYYDRDSGKWVNVSSERFDPGTSTWSKIADMGVSRREPFAARLADGRVLVAGGAVKVTWKGPRDQPGGVLTTTLTKTAEIWDPESDTWAPTVDMPDAREGGAAALLADGSVLLAGGDLGDQGEMSIGAYPFQLKIIATALRYYP